IELAIPFARKERHDFLAAMDKFGAVSPDAVGRVGLGNAGGLARIPSILGEPRLLGRGFGTKGRQGGTAHELTPCLFERSGPDSMAPSAARATGNAQAQSAITDTAAAATRQPTRKPTSNRSELFNRVTSVPVSAWRFLTCVYRKPKPGRSGDEVRQGWDAI